MGKPKITPLGCIDDMLMTGSGAVVCRSFLWCVIFLGTLGATYNLQLHKSADNTPDGNVICEGFVENMQGILRVL